MKFKLIKTFIGSAELNSIVDFGKGNCITKFGRLDTLLLTDCSNDFEHFVPYVLTTKDEGVDMFHGDTVYYLDTNNEIKSIVINYEDFLLQRYPYNNYFNYDFYSFENNIKTSFPFKIGDIIRGKDNTSMISYISLQHNVFYISSPLCSNLEKSFDELSNYRLATDEEKIEYYKEKGWRKGADFLIQRDMSAKNYVIEIEPHIVDGKVYINDNVLIRDCLLLNFRFPTNFEYLLYKGRKNYHVKDYIVTDTTEFNKLNCATIKQVLSTICFSQLSQLHAEIIRQYNFKNNCNWEPNWTILDDKYTVIRYGNKLTIIECLNEFKPLVFPTKELANSSMSLHSVLWKDYYELN